MKTFYIEYHDWNVHGYIVNAESLEEAEQFVKEKHKKGMLCNQIEIDINTEGIQFSAISDMGMIDE